jgi:hypothetical protein
MSPQGEPGWFQSKGISIMIDAVNFSPYRERQRKRKELKLLQVYEDQKQHYSEFREQYWPSHIRKRTKNLDRRRWNGKRAAFFEKSKWLTCTGSK